ncbi:MAG: I78 family peptidase inhibitor [Pseudomonadota bacterium]
MVPFALAACAGQNEPPAGQPVVLARVCDTADVQRFIGQKVTQAIGAEILAVTGARILRWGPPRSVWTMDYRPDRVNVSYGDDMIITKIGCS